MISYIHFRSLFTLTADVILQAGIYGLRHATTSSRNTEAKMTKWIMKYMDKKSYYCLCQGGYVSGSICLFVCLSVSSINQKVMNRLQ